MYVTIIIIVQPITFAFKHLCFVCENVHVSLSSFTDPYGIVSLRASCDLTFHRHENCECTVQSHTMLKHVMQSTILYSA